MQYGRGKDVPTTNYYVMYVSVQSLIVGLSVEITKMSDCVNG